MFRSLAIVVYGFFVAVALNASTAANARHNDNTCDPNVLADVIIVGAGIAGLSAALKLVKEGKCVLVLEADSNVGGKCRNWPIDQIRDYTQSGAPVVARNLEVSIGGSFYNPSMETTLGSLIREVGLSTLQSPAGNLTASQYLPMVFPSSLLSLHPRDYSVLTTAYTIGAKYPILSTAPPEIQQLQRISVETWLTTVNATATAKEMIREFVWFQMSVDANLQDAYSFCQYVSQVLPYDAALKIFPTGAVPPLLYQLLGGTGRLTGALAAKLTMMGVRIRKGVMVKSISDVANQYLIVTARKGRDVYHFQARKNVIVTVGPKQLKDINFVPKLGKNIRNVLAGEAKHKTVEYQVFAFFKTPWWYSLPRPRSPVIVPSQQLIRNMKTGMSGAPKIMGNAVDVPPIVSSYANVTYYGVMRIMVPGELFKSSSETIREDVISYLTFFNISVPPNQLMDVKVFDWSKVTNVNHGYFKTNVIVDNLGSKYLQVNGGQVNRILFAGTETATQFVNLMEGAARSGLYAANKVLSAVA